MSFTAEIYKQMGKFTLNAHIASEENGVLGLLGASGAGKSVTLSCIAGLITPTRGRIVLDGEVLYDSACKINLPPQKRHVGYLFQDAALFPHMTVHANCILGAADKARGDELFVKYMRLLRLEGLEHSYPQQLSGGQRQRVALARALIAEARLLLLDEPFAALDIPLKRELEDELYSVLQAFTGEVIYVSHDLRELYCECSHITTMAGGRTLCTGATSALFARPPDCESARLFGCRNFTDIIVKDGVATAWGTEVNANTGQRAGAYDKDVDIIAHDGIAAIAQAVKHMPNKDSVRLRLSNGAIIYADTAPYSVVQGAKVQCRIKRENIFIF